MSLITSCPACGTMFRVVSDQLKISEGWVRCGHCGEVFDATAHLSDESVLGILPEAQGTRPAGLAATPPPPGPPAAPQPSTLPSEWPTQPDEFPESRPAPPRTAPGRTAPARQADAGDRSVEPSDFFDEEAGDDLPPLEPSPLDAPFVFRRSELPVADLAPLEPGRESQLLPEDFDREEADEPVPDVSFVRQARRKAFWRRPFVRVLLSLLALALAGLLALQAAYQDRNRLALAQPQLRPALEQMCLLLDCQLGAPRQIDSIVIDSSGFNRVRSDTYRLAFTLRNTARLQVALPSMELTLTDSQDQVIARRVLTPAELGAGSGALPAAGEWSRAVGIAVDAGAGPQVAGYRLLAFYP
jgi:predicted Zn finger-like uncharacterized protein